ncbi:MAG: hypothetical protein WC333_01945 [Dehalococcoidia bacterium]|jgi:hypothetical protein
MKNLLFTILFAFIAISLFAQETQEKPSPFSAGADFYSSFIWRGSKLGTGPAFQPCVKYATDNLVIGAWGSFDASGFTETDLFFSYTLPFNLSLGMTDYYSPALEYFDYSDSTGSHAFEINAAYTIEGLTLNANYIINEAGGMGSKGGDMYFQALYQFKHFNMSVGAGDGWLTTDNKFNVCHIGIGTVKEIKITDKFSIPVTGQVVLNPEQEKLYVVVGFSL